MTGWLASIANEGELAAVLPARPDILDLKDPAAGALGAWPVAEVARLVRSVRAASGSTLISATVGDLAMDPDLVRPAAAAMAATGVDFVKLGLLPQGDPLACLAALAPEAARGARLVVVFFADLWGGTLPLDVVARAGIAGVMLDTARKDRGLLHHRGHAGLARFVAEARSLGLITGLAGSLGIGDIDGLVALGPDYLGFRGALCGGRGRTKAVDPAAVASVQAAFNRRRMPSACGGGQAAKG